MPNLYFLPGLMGTELQYQLPITGLWEYIWVSYIRIAGGYIGAVRLNDFGDGPGRPEGRPCRTAQPLYQYYHGAIATVQQQLSGDGYDVLPHPYDWRLRLTGLGADLADRIASEVDAADPCAIAAHSMGGLVARLAYTNLAARGKAGLVRRIVTMGTPHWGSYEIEELFSGVHRETQIIQQLSAGVSQLLGLGNLVPGRHSWSIDQLIGLYETWPGAYDLLPNMSQPSPPPDPHRELLYDRDNWPANRRPSGFHLAYARETTHLVLANPGTWPPPEVLTCIAGTGIATKGRLPDASYLGTYLQLPRDADGDGTVPVESAQLAGFRAVEAPGITHQDLPSALASAGTIRDEVLRVAPPPPPPAPPVVVQVGPGPGLAPLPFPDPRTFSLIDPGPAVPRHDC